MDIVQVLNFQY